MPSTAMWSCDFLSCSNPSVRNYGECIICDRHLCAAHLDQKYHKCPRWEVSQLIPLKQRLANAFEDEELYDPAAQEAERKEINDLLSKINVPALLSRASHLREGVDCSLSHELQYDRLRRSSVMGGMNYHIEIQFEDGVIWLARIRRVNATSPPSDLRRHIMRSEVATLQFLSTTKVPAPEVFDYNLEENPVGVEYILLEKMAGKSLRWSRTTREDRQRVMNQLADIYVELQKYPFDLMGSLNLPGTAQVGSFARESLTDYRDSQMKPIGPFTAPSDYLLSSIQLTLDLIRRGECYATRPIDAFLIHRFLLESAPRILSYRAFDDGNFYLKHADDKGDHILVDDSHNITGIVDWEWAHTDSKSVAFNSPVMLLPVAEFYGGVNDLGEDERYFAQLLEDKGSRDLAGIVRRGRILHLFNFCCGYDLADWNGFLGLFQSLRKALDSHDDLDWNAWREKAMNKYKVDPELKELVCRHSE